MVLMVGKELVDMLVVVDMQAPGKVDFAEGDRVVAVLADVAAADMKTVVVEIDRWVNMLLIAPLHMGFVDLEVEIELLAGVVVELVAVFVVELLAGVVELLI